MEKASRGKLSIELFIVLKVKYVVLIHTNIVVMTYWKQDFEIFQLIIETHIHLHSFVFYLCVQI